MHERENKLVYTNKQNPKVMLNLTKLTNVNETPP